MTFGTDGKETVIDAPATGAETVAIPVAAVADTANTGFCLDYQER
jgi:hypothetical protein